MFFLTVGIFRRQNRPPFFVKQLDDLHIMAGNSAILTCQVAGYPEAKIKWEFNNEVLTESDEDRQIMQIGDECSLVIQNVTMDHCGEYHCIAENHLGVAHTAGYLSVGGETAQPSMPHFVRYSKF